MPHHCLSFSALPHTSTPPSRLGAGGESRSCGTQGEGRPRCGDGRVRGSPALRAASPSSHALLCSEHSATRDHMPRALTGRSVPVVSTRARTRGRFIPADLTAHVLPPSCSHRRLVRVLGLGPHTAACASATSSPPRSCASAPSGTSTRPTSSSSLQRWAAVRSWGGQLREYGTTVP